MEEEDHRGDKQRRVTNLRRGVKREREVETWDCFLMRLGEGTRQDGRKLKTRKEVDLEENKEMQLQCWKLEKQLMDLTKQQKMEQLDTKK